MVLAGIAKFYAIYFSLQALANEGAIHISLPSMAGALSIVLFSLLMRIYDELKDAEADIRLGRAGDPRYMNRPIVTGAVTLDDLVILRWITTAALIVINFPLGGWPLIGFAVLFFVTWLSFKWFFCPVISEHLLLAFLTHNPISLVFGGYIVAVYAGDYGVNTISAWALALMLVFWAPLAAWETSRKIRAPEDETDYQTYSRAFGWKTAPFVPIFFIFLGTMSAILLAIQMQLSWIFPAMVAAASLIPVYRCIAFRVSPGQKTANIQPYVELYAVVMDLGLLVAVIASHGLDASRLG